MEPLDGCCVEDRTAGSRGHVWCGLVTCVKHSIVRDSMQVVVRETTTINFKGTEAISQLLPPAAGKLILNMVSNICMHPGIASKRWMSLHAFNTPAALGARPRVGGWQTLCINWRDKQPHMRVLNINMRPSDAYAYAYAYATAATATAAAAVAAAAATTATSHSCLPASTLASQLSVKVSHPQPHSQTSAGTNSTTPHWSVNRSESHSCDILLCVGLCSVQHVHACAESTESQLGCVPRRSSSCTLHKHSSDPIR